MFVDKHTLSLVHIVSTTECISGLNCDEKFCEPTNKADKWVRKYHSLANERLPPARYPPASEFAPAFAL